MSSIKELRKVVNTQLNSITGSGKTYFKKAEKEAIYPHKVFNLTNADLGNFPREDFIITIDVWTKDANAADDITDSIIKKFNDANLPDNDILPTFYVVELRDVEDEDKSIERRQIKIQCQNYERS